jgi:hypothetical protein
MTSSNASRARQYLQAVASLGPFETLADFYTPDVVIQEFPNRIAPHGLSKHQFTPPQGLAILCLMRYEDGTFRETRVEQQRGGKTRYKHDWKWLVIANVHRPILLAQRARQGPWMDTRALPGGVDAADPHVRLGVVLADAQFDSEANPQPIRQRWGAQSIIPAQPRRAREVSAEALGTTREDRNDLFGGPAQTLLPRSGAQLAFADPPSFVARPDLSPLPLAAPRPLRGCQQSHFNSIRINTYAETRVKSFRISTSGRTGGRGYVRLLKPAGPLFRIASWLPGRYALPRLPQGGTSDPRWVSDGPPRPASLPCAARSSCPCRSPGAKAGG